MNTGRQVLHLPDPRVCLARRQLAEMGISAEAQITLAVNGTTLPVAQLGPDFVILENPPALSPQSAEITLTIDGHQRRRQVHLLDGIPAHAASPAIYPRHPSASQCPRRLPVVTSCRNSDQPRMTAPLSRSWGTLTIVSDERQRLVHVDPESSAAAGGGLCHELRSEV